LITQWEPITLGALSTQLLRVASFLLLFLVIACFFCAQLRDVVLMIARQCLAMDAEEHSSSRSSEEEERRKEEMDEEQKKKKVENDCSSRIATAEKLNVPSFHYNLHHIFTYGK
jgi:hypothetical protein